MRARFAGHRFDALALAIVIFGSTLVIAVVGVMAYLAIDDYEPFSCLELANKADNASMPEKSALWDDYALLCG